MLETERLLLIPFDIDVIDALLESDAVFLHKYGYINDGGEFVNPSPDYLDKCKKRLIEHPEDYPVAVDFLIIVKELKTVIGSIDFKYLPKNGVSEIGYGMNPKYEGHGYMSEAVELMLNFGKENGISKVVADTKPSNIKSQNVLKRNGFILDKTEGEMLWFKKDLKQYYEAYEERYKTIHQKGYSWSSDIATPIVLQTLSKYGIQKNDKILEIGCGEGRDANQLLKEGYNLLATDISKEAIKYCQSLNPDQSDCFKTLDCLSDNHDAKYRFIYAIAVIHMFVLDEDRQKFYSFIYNHLEENGFALICTMGNGKTEMQSDIKEAFELRRREHSIGEVEVAATSCRIVNFDTFNKEIKNAQLAIMEEGITSSSPDFSDLMFAVVKKP